MNLTAMRRATDPDLKRDIATRILTVESQLQADMCRLIRHRESVLLLSKHPEVAAALTAQEIHEIETHCARVQNVVQAIKRGTANDG